MSQCPLARTDDLVVEPLDDELLVFDSRVDRAHSLNASAAAVWRACDGTRTREQLAAECGIDALGVDLALESLAGCELLVDFTPDGERVSRRAVLRRMAVTGAAVGVALPVIRSIAAPSAQAAGASGSRCPGGCPGGYCDSRGSCHAGTAPANGAHCSGSLGNPANPCGSQSYCSYGHSAASTSFCQSGLASSHGPGHSCPNGNISCSYNVRCHSGTCDGGIDGEIRRTKRTH